MSQHKTEGMIAEIDVEFDRTIITPGTPNAAPHYISPGTVHIEFDDGTVIPFDFVESAATAEGKLLVIEERGLDVPVFPSSRLLGEYLRDYSVVGLQMFIYTGEDDEPEIHPVAIRHFHLWSEGVGPDRIPVDFTAGNELLDKAKAES